MDPCRGGSSVRAENEGEEERKERRKKEELGGRTRKMNPLKCKFWIRHWTHGVCDLPIMTYRR